MLLKIASVSAALALSAPAFGITVNMTDFSYHRAPLIAITGGPLPTTFSAGELTGVVVDGGSLALKSLHTNVVASGPSFNAYCAELPQLIDFHTSYIYAQTTGAAYLGADKSNALGRLFTATAMTGFVKDADTSAAMQAAIWEIIYQSGNSYDLTGGAFQATAVDPSANPATVAALSAVNNYLLNLSSYSADYKIEVLTNPIQQDLVIGTVPEPGTWALMAAGLVGIGALARRRRAARSSP